MFFKNLTFLSVFAFLLFPKFQIIEIVLIKNRKIYKDWIPAIKWE